MQRGAAKQREATISLPDRNATISARPSTPDEYRQHLGRREALACNAVKEAWLVVTDQGAIRERADILLPDPGPHRPSTGDRAFVVRPATTPGIVAAGTLALGNRGWRCRIELARGSHPVSPRDVAADPVLGGRAHLALSNPGWSPLTPLVTARLELLLRNPPPPAGGAEWSDGDLEVSQATLIDFGLKVAEVLQHPDLEFGILLPKLATAEFFVLPEGQTDNIVTRLGRLRIRTPQKLAGVSPFRLSLRPGWGPDSVRKAAEVAVATAEFGRHT